MRNSILHLPGMHNAYNHEDAQVNADYCLKHKSAIRANGKAEAQRGGAGRTGRHLLGAANRRKLFLKIHVKIQIVISYVLACNKNKALQLQRVPILSILGYNIGSLAASSSTLLVLRQFCVGAGQYRLYQSVLFLGSMTSHVTSKPKTKGRQI